EQWATFASAPSAPSSSLWFNALARTVCAPLSSASLAIVRSLGGVNPLAGLDFGPGADDADGADGRVSVFSGWVVLMWMVRVREWPSRPKLISMPILRREFAARRSRPARARGLSGQLLDLAARSPTASARVPISSEAVPVHTVAITIIAHTAAATGS